MMQQTLAAAADQEAGFEQYRRPTRRDVFLATMEENVLWQALYAVIQSHYPKPGNGRPPVGLQRMLRMYFVQHGFKLADQACEEARLDSPALRHFVGIDLGRKRVPAPGQGRLTRPHFAWQWLRNLLATRSDAVARN